MRLFVSVDLPEAFADPIAAIQEEFADAAGIRPTDPTQAHVTMKFLGETDPARLDAVTEALETAVGAAGVGPFEATVGGLGAFPSEDYIRVVWIGVEDGGAELTRLHEAIEERTTALGFDPEEHDFTPHATIARMDHAGGKDRVQQVLRERDPTVGTMDVREVRLKESDLTEDGPVYSTVTSVSLPD